MGLEAVDVCPVCAGQSFIPCLSTKDYTTTGETFHLIECNQCSLVITSPRPEENSIAKYYNSDRYISHTGGNKGLADIAYRQIRRFTLLSKKKIIEQFNSRGILLDYGCGTGEFLVTCQSAGWKAIGIEPSAAAREKIGQEVQVFENLTDQEFKVDVVTLWHVLEHVHELNATLRQLFASLNKGGTIFIAVPNTDSFDAHYYTNYWAAYDVPRHLWHFKKNNMVQLLQRHGFKLKKILPMKLDSYYVSLLSEQNKNPGSWLLVRIMRALRIGMISNLQAKTDNHSSLLYIAQS